MFYRGREITHKEIGKRLIEKLVQDIEKQGKVDRAPQMFGKTMIMTLCPK